MQRVVWLGQCGGLNPPCEFSEKIMKSFISLPRDCILKTYILIRIGCAAATLATRPRGEELGQHSKNQGRQWFPVDLS